MNRFIAWLTQLDRRLFYLINGSMSHKVWDHFFSRLTHLGGAIFSCILTAIIWLWAPDPWNHIGLQSLIALIASHIPVAILKRKLHRLRPYLTLKGANIFPKPLKDHSFPSGHTTAIFSITVPFMVAVPAFIVWLAPLACLVGISRIYLGLHYPSDVLAGGIVGSAAGAIVAMTI